MWLAYAQGWWVVLLGVGMKESWFDLKGVVILDVPCAMTWSNRKRQGIFLYGKPRTRVLKARGLEVVLMLKANAGIKPYILRLTIDGTPFHPLYLPGTLQPTLRKL
jgi:hypothetical protein